MEMRESGGLVRNWELMLGWMVVGGRGEGEGSLERKGCGGREDARDGSGGRGGGSRWLVWLWGGGGEGVGGIRGERGEWV